MADEVIDHHLPVRVNDDFYVAPDTEIYILKGVPLDNTYEHTIVWENLSADRKQQTNYFLSKAAHGVLKNSYQRIDREWFKIYVNADSLWDCNYIMFRNTAFHPTKWWYGFILDVEYINNNTAKVKYEIDVMQTWLPGANLDYDMLPCFIERCHSRSDSLYSNLIPESIVNSDEYVVDEVKEFDMNAMSVIVLSTERYIGEGNGVNYQKFTPADGEVRNGTYGKVFYWAYKIYDEAGNFDSYQYESLNNTLTGFINAGKEDSVLGVYMFPTKLLRYRGYVPANGPYQMERVVYELSITPPKKNLPLGGIDNYIPKNMKLYSFPFSLIRANNECGNTKIYKFELFDKYDVGKFYITGSDCWIPCAIIYPTHYKNISKNMEDSLTFDQFIICPWGSDSYRAWWAQNAAQVNTSVISGVASLIAAIVGTGVGGATANPMLVATGVGGAISSAAKINESLYSAKHQSSALHGSTTSLILPELKNTKFVLTRESLRAEMLKIYDDYFTKYGYAQKEIMKPSLVNRERWTYVQTVGFEFNGTINDKDTKKIKSIFDNGITFWRNPSELGNYELSNQPIE